MHRVGIIGLGTVGSRFVEQFGRHADFDLVSAWDPDPLACEVHADAVPIAGGAGGVIAESDAVYIAVPPAFHRTYVEACVDAGVAVFCEKPLGIDIAESRALVDLVERSGLPAGVNFVFGAAPSAVGLLSALESGQLGSVVRGDLRLHFAEWPRAWHARAQWLRLRDQGGWIREVVSHFLFLALRTFGALRLETSSVGFPDGPDGELCETEAIARFDAAGTPLLVTGTSGGVGPDVVDFTVRGTDASVRVLDWYRLQSTGGGPWTDLLGADRAALGAAAYDAQLGELSAMLDGRPNAMPTFAEALVVQELIESMRAGT